MRSLGKLKTVLRENKSFVLVCHINPDGDAIGAMMALNKALVADGKKVSCVCKEPIPLTFRFLDPENIIAIEMPEWRFDTIVLIDNGDSRRTGIGQLIPFLRREGVLVANIDHHQKNDLWKMVDINCVDDTASSASEIVFKLLLDGDYDIDPTIATALLAGVYNDTGGFRHSNTKDKVLNIFSDLLKRGAKLKKVADAIENHHSIAKFKLWGIALDRLVLNKKYKIACSLITKKDIEKTNASEDDISGLVNLLNSVPEAKAALLLYESENDKIKGSFRTERDDVDVSKLAGSLGGGGHKKAAGFMIDGRIELSDNSWKII